MIMQEQEFLKDSIQLFEKQIEKTSPDPVLSIPIEVGVHRTARKCSIRDICPFGWLFALILQIVIFSALTLETRPVWAQSTETTVGNQVNGQEQATQAALKAIISILKTQNAKRANADQLRQAIDDAKTEVDKNELLEKLRIVNLELTKLEDQIVTLATGVAESELNPVDESFELQRELEQLVSPFVLMLKSATENAREIEQLKRLLLAASEEKQKAEDAIAQITPLIEQAPQSGPLQNRLQVILQDWETRLTLAQDQTTTVRQQLHARENEKVDPADVASSAFTSFFSDRGRNLFFGVVAFFLVLVLLRLLRRVLLALIGAPRNRRFTVRLCALIYDALTVCLAFGTTIAIFNFYNDWFLTGAMLLVFLTMGWFILKSLPSLFEQVTLLLNLGAVQEGERVVINNVPWCVTKLDLYTELENPTLRGGHYTVPVRELRGQHSRPMDGREKWFPCVEGDWVVLDNGLWAEVILQSPEAVHLREEGGAVTHLTTTAFLGENPKNVSHTFRATIEFGIDYSHQSEAADKIPKIMQDYIDCRIREMFGTENILGTYVNLFRAGASSLDFEIEADVGPNMGYAFETIEHVLARVAVECCTKNGWTIPFPQLTVHRP
ncbi:MAG: hypothetical protein ABJN26_19345 [Stappiaceae bacterium]